MRSLSKITATAEKNAIRGFAVGDTPAVRTWVVKSEASPECPREVCRLRKEESVSGFAGGETWRIGSQAGALLSKRGQRTARRLGEFLSVMTKNRLAARLVSTDANGDQEVSPEATFVEP